MSMIGLFTAGTHAATATTATDDPAAASGFGAALQGALVALTGATDTSTEPTVAIPLGEPEATPPELSDAPTPLGRALGSETPDPVLGSINVTHDAVPLLEIDETTTDRPEPVSTDPHTLIELVETPAVFPLPDAEAPAAVVPLVEPGLTPPAPSDATATADRAVANGAQVSTPAAGTTAAASNTTALPPAVVAEDPAAKPVPAPSGSVSGMHAAPPAEVPETATGSTVPASLPTARQPDASAGAVPLGQPLETRVTNPASASTSQASAAASASVPAAARGPVETAAQMPTVVAAPSSTPATPVAPAAPVAAPSPAASAPLATQLARPIFSLAAAGAGQHVMTVSVTPENLGPVTLRAHVGADGVRVELFAPNDIGRDAIRAIIPELRRDLAGAGLGGNLTLSSQNQPSAGPDHSAAGRSGAEHGDRDGTADPTSAGTRHGANDTPSAEPDSRPRSFGPASTIDVLA